MFLTSFLAATPENPRFNLNSPEAYDTFLGGPQSDAGVAVNDQSALTYSPWWRGVDLISGSVAKVPVFVYRRTAEGKERATTHPAWRLLRRKANERQTAFDWLKLMTAHKLSKGNAYSYILRDGAGRPVELLPLDPNVTTPVLETVEGVSRLLYVTHVNGTPRKLLPENVLHFRGLGFDGLAGFSVVQMARQALGHGLAAQRCATIVFKNGARPSVVLTFPGTLDEKVKTSVVTGWERMNSGLDNFHRTALLDRGLGVTELTSSLEETQLLESREFSIRDVANYLGCPAYKLGDATVTSSLSLEQQNQGFIDDCLDLHFVCIEHEVWDKLLTEEEKDGDSTFVEFNRAALVRGDLAARANYYRTALGGRPWMIPDEVRDLDNMNPLGGEAGTYLNPLNMGKGGGQNDPTTPDKPPPGRPTKEQALRMQEPFLRDVVGRLVRRVGAQATKAAEKPAEFVAWVDGMEESNRAAFRDACSALELAIRHAGGTHAYGDLAVVLLGTAKQGFARVADTATAKELAGKVAEQVAQLEQHAAALLAERFLGDAA